MADPVRVRQIVRNLLTNASRYGGPCVRVETRTADGLATLTVIDNGDGVADEMAGSLFEPYGHLGASQAENSVGLGLHVSRALARLMGGDLGYERVAGETHFRLELPLPVAQTAGQVAAA
jgi:signal transduction histidine kinase